MDTDMASQMARFGGVVLRGVILKASAIVVSLALHIASWAYGVKVRVRIGPSIGQG